MKIGLVTVTALFTAMGGIPTVCADNSTLPNYPHLTALLQGTSTESLCNTIDVSRYGARIPNILSVKLALKSRTFLVGPKINLLLSMMYGDLFVFLDFFGGIFWDFF